MGTKKARRLAGRAETPKNQMKTIFNILDGLVTLAPALAAASHSFGDLAGYPDR